MSDCPTPNLTGSCEPPFPPPTPIPTSVEWASLCRCEAAITGLAGINGGVDFDNYITGNGFLVDVFVRKDTSESGTQLEDAFYLRWPAQISGDHYEVSSSVSCGFSPTLYVLRGQWVVFRQQDPSNFAYPIVITTSNTGEAESSIYSITGTDPTDGAILYRDGTDSSVGAYSSNIPMVGSCINSPCGGGGCDPCPNIAFRVPACGPDVLYYRHRTSQDQEIIGGKIVIVGSLPGFDCTVAGTCAPRERPWETPLSPLSLGDTFFEWYTATNNIISAVDPLRIYDVKLLGGLKELIPNQNGILYIEADVGAGLRIFPPTSPNGGFPQDCAEGKIVLDIFGLPEVEVTGSLDKFEDRKSLNQVKETDLFVFERFINDDGTPSRRGIDPANTAASLFKVKAENLLPYTVAGDHRFTGKIYFESPSMEINATKLTIDDKAIELGATPFMEFDITLISGTAANLVTGMSHDPDGDHYYYESAGNETDGTTPGNTYSGVTGEIVVQEHTVYTSYARDTTYDTDAYDFVPGDYLNRGPGFNASDTDGDGQNLYSGPDAGGIYPTLTGTEYSRATVLEISNIVGSTATIRVRAFNDVPFKAGNAYTTRSGVTFSITAIRGQAGNDVDVNGGGVILKSSQGNKSILWANSNDAWTLNQNLAIDTKYHLLAPFNIANGATNFADNSTGTHNYWRVQQFLDATTITGTHCLDSSDNGTLNFGFVTGGVLNASTGYAPALSILPCGGIYIHNIACSPQFTTQGGTSPNSIAVTNEFGVLDHTHQDRIFVPVTGIANHTDFDVGDVVGIDATGAMFLARADTRDNAEVLGIVVQLVTGGGSGCSIGGGSAASEGWLVATGNLIDWTAGMCGLSSLTPGSVYFLNPITGGTLVDCEPLDVGYIRKPVALAVNQSQLLVTNYEGVVNGDYFQENPVMRLDDLRDVDAPVTGVDALQDGQILVWNGTTEMWENRDNVLTFYQQSVTGDNGGTTNNFGLTFGPEELAAEHDFPVSGGLFVADFEVAGSVAYDPPGGGAVYSEGWFHGVMRDICIRLDGTGGSVSRTFTTWTKVDSISGAGHALHLDSGGLWNATAGAEFTINQSTREITLVLTFDPGSQVDGIADYVITARMTNVRMIPIPTVTP